MSLNKKRKERQRKGVKVKMSFLTSTETCLVFKKAAERHFSAQQCDKSGFLSSFKIKNSTFSPDKTKYKKYVNIKIKYVNIKS